MLTSWTRIKGQHRTTSLVCVRSLNIPNVAKFIAPICCCFIPCRSPLMIAAGNGQIGMLRLLLRFEADITLKDGKGWSADDYAVMNGHHP